MTVKELIEELKKMPQDVTVARMNTEEDRYYPTHYEEIFTVEFYYKNEYDYEVRIS